MIVAFLWVGLALVLPGAAFAVVGAIALPRNQRLVDRCLDLALCLIVPGALIIMAAQALHLLGVH